MVDTEEVDMEVIREATVVAGEEVEVATEVVGEEVVEDMEVSNYLV